MKRVTLLCAILIVALFAVGCNDQKAPTGLSESTPVVPASSKSQRFASSSISPLIMKT
jgi:hypothetical protein